MVTCYLRITCCTFLEKMEADSWVALRPMTEALPYALRDEVISPLLDDGIAVQVMDFEILPWALGWVHSNDHATKRPETEL